MSKAILQLNDLNLVWQSEHGQYANSIGVAHISDQGIVCGIDAWNKLWLEPQHCYTQYWQQFNQNSLSPAKPGIRHNADLVFHQLQQINAQYNTSLSEQPLIGENQLLISPPSHFRQSELELLLAVGQSLQLPVCSFIDPAVMAVASSAINDSSSVNRVLYIDMQLHQSVITEVLSLEGRWVKGSVIPLGDCGLLQLLNTSAHYLAELFIREHRFDPLKLAVTSQFLYQTVFDRLLFSTSDFPLELESKDGRLNCTISLVEWRKMLSTRLASLLDTVREQLDDSSTVCLLDNYRWLANHLDDSKAPIKIKDEDISAKLFQLWPVNEVEGLVYIDSLERKDVRREIDDWQTNHSGIDVVKGADKRSVPVDISSQSASHVLFNDCAYPLKNGLWLTYINNELQIYCQSVPRPVLIIEPGEQGLTTLWDMKNAEGHINDGKYTEGKKQDLAAIPGEDFEVFGQQLRFISVKNIEPNEQLSETTSLDDAS